MPQEIYLRCSVGHLSDGIAEYELTAKSERVQTDLRTHLTLEEVAKQDRVDVQRGSEAICEQQQKAD